MKPLPLFAALLLAPAWPGLAAPEPPPQPTEQANGAVPLQPEKRPVRPAFAMSNQLIENGAFELPPIQGRVSSQSPEGDFTQTSGGEWEHFTLNEAGRTGGLEAGLTDETARTGRQSLYVNFKNVTAPQAAVELSSRLLRVLPKKVYRVGIFGRIDGHNPLALDQRAPVLRLRVDFYAADHETQAGPTAYRVQPIPGTPNRPLFFTAERWSEYFFRFEAPPDAAYLRVSWTWSTTPEVGKTNGAAFFDDATVEGEKESVSLGKDLSIMPAPPAGFLPPPPLNTNPVEFPTAPETPASTPPAVP